jgi:hypothetical protein
MITWGFQGIDTVSRIYYSAFLENEWLQRMSEIEMRKAASNIIKNVTYLFNYVSHNLLNANFAQSFAILSLS